MRNIGTRERGATLVEFALAIALFFLLLFGVIEFSMAWNEKQSLTQAVRETARQGIVGNYGGGFASCNSGDPIADLECQAEARLDMAGATATASFSGGSASVGGQLTIDASATLESVTGIMAPFLDGRTIESSISMRVERVP